ncbi:MAG TPA: substrate-binding domain-containing protein [Syntrophales bacterium]|jgi:excisionase family DNA binding protein|nr:substrate-binding domain-containing protein [Syntrophales bacterium]HRT61509.1 substrate-binding domain-containing protein [Syntrophales bacterium]
MPEEMMNTKEVAAYLGINEKQVYALIKAGRIPGTRVTGKWVFPKKLVDEWIEETARGGLRQARDRSRGVAGAFLASGSNDPVLDFLLTDMRHTHPDFYFFCANTGSTEGLKALGGGYTDIAWTHLLDPKTDRYNIPFLEEYLPGMKAVLVHLFRREIGIVAAPGNPRGIESFEDLTAEGLRFVNRQAGSGTRLLLDHHLKKNGIVADAIRGYNREVYTHIEVGLAILSGESDAGLATVAVSKLMGLHFVPVARENFDMALGQSTYFSKGVQALVDTLRSDGLRKRFEKLGGYGFEDSGKILYSTL